MEILTLKKVPSILLACTLFIMCFTLSGCNPKAPPLDHIPLSLENYSEYLDIFITPNYLDDGLCKSFRPLVEISTKYSSDDIVSSSSVTINFFCRIL